MKNILPLKTNGENGSSMSNAPKKHWVILAFIGLFAWAGLLAWQSYASYLRMPRGFSILPELFSLSRFGPFQSSLFISHWLGTFKLYALLLGYGVGTLGTGLFIQKRFFPSVRSRLESVVIGFALGFATLSLGTFFLGVLGGYHTKIFIWVYAVFVTFGAMNLWKQREVLKATPGWWLGSKPPLVDWVLGSLIVLLIVFEYVSANAPELFFDALVYHLGVPTQWIQHGGLVPLPNIVFSNMPMNIEMLYTGALMLADERLCRLLHVSLGALATLAVFVLGRRWFGQRVGLWASGIFIMIPLSMLNAIVAGVDVGSSFFTIAALLVLMNVFFSEHIERRELWLAGLLTGVALGSKYTTAITLIPALLVLFGVRVVTYKESVKTILVSGVNLGAGILVCLSPWLVKNVIVTGNPVFPFLYQIIPTRFLHPGKIQWLMETGFREFSQRTWLQYIQVFWNQSFSVPGDSSFIGVAFLFLLPGFVFWGWRIKRNNVTINALMMIGLLAVLFWSRQTQIARFLLSGFTILAILGAWVLLKVEDWSPCFGQTVRWLLLSFLSFWLVQGVIFGYAMWDPLGVSLGLQNRVTYFQKHLQTDYTPMARLVNQFPKDSKIYAFGETRSHYFERSITTATAHDTTPLIEWLDKDPTAEAVWLRLRRAGYTHFYVHAQEAVRTRGFEPYHWTPEAVARWQELIDRYMHRTIKLQQQSLYVILPEPKTKYLIKPGRPLFTYDENISAKVNERSDVALRLLQQNQWVQAQAAWQSIAELAPMWEVPYTMLAWMYQQQQKNKEALAMYQRADSLADLSPEMYHDLGVLYWTMGQRKDAIRAMKAAVAQAPGFTMAVKDLESMENKMQQNQ